MSGERKCVSWFHFSAICVGVWIAAFVSACIDHKREADLESRIAALEAARVEAGR